MERFSIENEQVKTIYVRLWKGFSNKDLSDEARLEFFKRIQLVQALVEVYEGGHALHEEEIDDLFIKYGETMRPLFPEEMDNWLKRLTEEKEV